MPYPPEIIAYVTIIQNRLSVVVLNAVLQGPP